MAQKGVPSNIVEAVCGSVKDQWLAARSTRAGRGRYSPESGSGNSPQPWRGRENGDLALGGQEGCHTWHIWPSAAITTGNISQGKAATVKLAPRLVEGILHVRGIKAWERWGRPRHAHQLSHRLYVQSTELTRSLAVHNAPLRLSVETQPFCDVFCWSSAHRSAAYPGGHINPFGLHHTHTPHTRAPRIHSSYTLHSSSYTLPSATFAHSVYSRRSLSHPCSQPVLFFKVSPFPNHSKTLVALKPDCQPSIRGCIYIVDALDQNLHTSGYTLGVTWKVLAHTLKSPIPSARWRSEVSPGQLSIAPQPCISKTIMPFSANNNELNIAVVPSNSHHWSCDIKILVSRLVDLGHIGCPATTQEMIATRHHGASGAATLRRPPPTMMSLHHGTPAAIFQPPPERVLPHSDLWATSGEMRSSRAPSFHLGFSTNGRTRKWSHQSYNSHSRKYGIECMTVEITLDKCVTLTRDRAAGDREKPSRRCRTSHIADVICVAAFMQYTRLVPFNATTSNEVPHTGVGALELRCGDRQLRHAHHAQLRSRTHRPKEPLQELWHDTMEMSYKFLEGCSKEACNVIAVGLVERCHRQQQAAHLAAAHNIQNALTCHWRINQHESCQHPDAHCTSPSPPLHPHPQCSCTSSACAIAHVTPPPPECAGEWKDCSSGRRGVVGSQPAGSSGRCLVLSGRELEADEDRGVVRCIRAGGEMQLDEGVTLRRIPAARLRTYLTPGSDGRPVDCRGGGHAAHRVRAWQVVSGSTAATSTTTPTSTASVVGREVRTRALHTTPLPCNMATTIQPPSNNPAENEHTAETTLKCSPFMSELVTSLAINVDIHNGNNLMRLRYPGLGSTLAPVNHPELKTSGLHHQLADRHILISLLPNIENYHRKRFRFYTACAASVLREGSIAEYDHHHLAYRQGAGVLRRPSWMTSWRNLLLCHFSPIAAILDFPFFPRNLNFSFMLSHSVLSLVHYIP
ncbi:hypothetical protein PR048_019643 [Dryococelus australis]|uniref:Uncharacterized protein n=1 Tax=Dryococelus australis TaxID=614101 RepID=A0ABQ9H439_9NEOP|nr:hypothetical protein PR048_019643 [Dryococelus australis]